MDQNFKNRGENESARERDSRDLTASLEERVEAAIADRDRTWNNARDLLAVIDSHGAFRAANPAWTALLGWRPDEVVGRGCLEFIAVEDQASAQQALAKARCGRLEYEVRCRHKDGCYRWISWVSAVEGGLIYANGRDVTAEKEAAEAIEQAESRFRAIFTSSYQYKAIVSLNGQVLDANPASLQGIEANLDSVAGKFIWETPWYLATPGMAETIRSAVEAAAHGHIIRREILLNLPAGVRCFDFTVRPISDGRGDVVAVVCEGADITARRRAEEALRQSQKLEVVGQLTGGMAHDFNNLLTPIMGSLDVLQRKCHEDPRALRLIDGAIQSTERARLLVQRLLAFARRQHLEARPVDMNRLIEGVLNLVGRSLGSDIDIRVDIAPDIPAARVDPNQLEMALLNLAVNAREAMPDGGVIMIRAKMQSVDADTEDIARGDYVCLSVMDNGIGMKPETLDRAVEPFFTTKAIGKGTGLGLSMVHGLAAQSGGRLTLESEPEKGTTATLWLPAADQPGQRADAEKINIVQPALLSVLLVDDDDLVRSGTAAMIETMGHTVSQACSARQALEHLTSSAEYDVLITDLRMPEMTGWQLIRRARSLRPNLPAVIITGYTDAMEAGLSGPALLTKPFRARELQRALSEAIANGSGTKPG